MAEKREKGGEVAPSPADMGVAGGDGEGNGNSSMKNAETLLRLLPMALCLVALVLMFKNSQSNDYGSLSYSDVAAFRYLVHANGICAAYSLLSAIYAAVPRPFTKPRAWAFFFFDQALTYVIIAAGAVATEVMYLAYNGDAAITWSSDCGSFHGFCRKAMASVAITFISVACYAALSLLSSYRLFSNYAEPVGFYQGSRGIHFPVFRP